MNMPASRKPPLALIAGPTASGKSALALALAQAAGGTIINADSAQVYRDLAIVSARPSAEEEARVPHALYGYRDGGEICSAADWAADARAAIAAAHAAGRLPVLVGGTGLYIRTLIEGIAPVPDIDPGIRAAVRALAVAEAHAALGREDPEAAARIRPERHDPDRAGAGGGALDRPDAPALAAGQGRRHRRRGDAAAPDPAAAARLAPCPMRRALRENVV